MAAFRRARTRLLVPAAAVCDSPLDNAEVATPRGLEAQVLLLVFRERAPLVRAL
jgi:hypothetical protein